MIITAMMIVSIVRATITDNKKHCFQTMGNRAGGITYHPTNSSTGRSIDNNLDFFQYINPKWFPGYAFTTKTLGKPWKGHSNFILAVRIGNNPIGHTTCNRGPITFVNSHELSLTILLPSSTATLTVPIIEASPHLHRGSPSGNRKGLAATTKPLSGAAAVSILAT